MRSARASTRDGYYRDFKIVIPKTAREGAKSACLPKRSNHAQTTTATLLKKMIDEDMDMQRMLEERKQKRMAKLEADGRLQEAEVGSLCSNLRPPNTNSS
jgi:hypothetical protein